MAITVGFDVYRGQITFDALDGATGEVTTGRIAPADSGGLRRFLERWDGQQVEAAVEATTGWRFAGLDVTVHESDDKRRPGHLSRQGPPVLRWAAFEAAESACKPSSPDHAYYLQLKARVGQNRAVLSVARKLLRRAHHTLRELGDDALLPAA